MNKIKNALFTFQSSLLMILMLPFMAVGFISGFIIVPLNVGFKISTETLLSVSTKVLTKRKQEK